MREATLLGQRTSRPDLASIEPYVVAWFCSGDTGGDLAAPLPVADHLIEGCCVVVCTYRRADSLDRFLSSLTSQSRPPERLIVVDAGPDDASEQVVRAWVARGGVAGQTVYFRVTGPLKGLTRQRNFALRWVTTDLVAFFDDDVVLLPGCLEEMERAHRTLDPTTVGVGAAMDGPSARRQMLWRVRRGLGIVGDLRPGRYHRSGMSTPWPELPPDAGQIDGDWLSGCAAMWRTRVARVVGYDETLTGYAQAEDLDFSLRAGRWGRIVVAAGARVRHLHEPSGRPDAFTTGYMAIYNRYRIHRRGLAGRRRRDVAWFIYAWTVDTLMLARHLIVPRRTVPTLREIAGRLYATGVLLRESVLSRTSAP